MWYVYILELTNGKLYIGVTDDLDRRVDEHRHCRGGAFTSRCEVNKLLYSEGYEQAQEAYKREKQLKRWSRAKKLALINKDFDLLRFLSHSKRVI